MSHIFLLTFPLLPSFGLLLIHTAYLRLGPGSSTTNLSIVSFCLANFPALTAFQGHLFLSIKPFPFFLRKLIWQCFQDCCHGESVPIAPSSLWWLLGPLLCVSVSWLPFLRLNNLYNCREFPLDKGKGTVTGKLWLPFLKYVSSCPSRQLQSPLKSDFVGLQMSPGYEGQLSPW